MRITRSGFSIGAALAVLAVGCSSKTTTVVQPPGSSNGISVSGTGRATGSPDVVLLSLGVSLERPTVEAARSDAASSQQAVIDAIKADGVADKDIQTVQFSIEPQYDNAGRIQTLRAYRVSNVVRVKVRKVDAAGKVIDDVTKAGGNDVVVQRISFTIDDPTKLQTQARDDAMKQAKVRASELADHAGLKLGGPISISETGTSNQPVAAPAAFAARADVSTPIQSGDLVVSVTVSVVYALAQ